MADVPAEQRGQLKDQSQITVQGVPLPQALASGGKGSSEPPPSQPQEGTQKK